SFVDKTGFKHIITDRYGDDKPDEVRVYNHQGELRKEFYFSHGDLTKIPGNKLTPNLELTYQEVFNKLKKLDETLYPENDLNFLNPDYGCEE
ncbi:hypothetical protein KY321_00905, partial [Candidatus Woesearchaeota archaeon]|nr:hypothetical protein [Candidatus Woesearchaeota archaeon]